MRVSKQVLFACALTAAAGAALAQRPASSSQGLGANPPPVSMPTPPRRSASPVSAPTPAPANAPVATAAASGLAGDAAAAEQTYILGPADVIEVGILGVTSYTTRARISEDGTIQLQYLGAVNAANRTAAQLSDQVSAALEKGGFFSHPVVRVDVVSYASRYVTVLGAFTTPGLVPVDRAYHLSEVVARVGGVRENGADYVILRPQHGPERHISIATLATGAASDDPIVSPGDKIYSPPAEVVFVTGQVKTPGAFGIMRDMTVRMALSRAAGITDSGSDKKVTITRKGTKLGHVDLDSKVEPGDVIVVGERLF